MSLQSELNEEKEKVQALIERVSDLEKVMRHNTDVMKIMLAANNLVWKKLEITNEAVVNELTQSAAREPLQPAEAGTANSDSGNGNVRLPNQPQQGTPERSDQRAEEPSYSEATAGDQPLGDRTPPSGIIGPDQTEGNTSIG